MIDTLIACDNEDNTLGGFFEECANHAKSIFDSVPLPVIELYSKQLNDLSVALKVSQINSKDFLFTAYSHGADDCLVVGATNPYISHEVNHTIFKNAFFYTFACSCGKELGETLIKNGANLFWGYDKPVYVILSHSQVFTECANEGLKLICAGKSIADTVVGVAKKYDDNIDGTYKFDMVIAATLMDNRDALIVLGKDGVDFDTFKLYN